MSQNPVLPPTNQQAVRPADGLAVASLICGVFGLASICVKGCGLPVAIAGLVCGLMSKTPGGVRTAGIVCSSIAIGLCAVVLILAVVFGVVLFGIFAGAAAGSHSAPVTP